MGFSLRGLFHHGEPSQDPAGDPEKVTTTGVEQPLAEIPPTVPGPIAPETGGPVQPQVTAPDATPAPATDAIPEIPTEVKPASPEAMPGVAPAPQSEPETKEPPINGLL